MGGSDRRWRADAGGQDVLSCCRIGGWMRLATIDWFAWVVGPCDWVDSLLVVGVIRWWRWGRWADGCCDELVDSIDMVGGPRSVGCDGWLVDPRMALIRSMWLVGRDRLDG